ncbi:MAG: hypothetical protein R2684_15395 [Pyrinomonadaceae bacterium]
MPTALCPICQGRVFVDSSSDMGEVIVCDECDSELELVGMDPIELDPLTETDEEEYDDGFNIFEGDED